MSSGKRGPQKSVGKHGGNTAKKVKTGDGPDIPSSNFSSMKNKQPSKYSTLTPQMITSLSSTKQNLQNPNAILQKLNLPNVYKDVMGDSDELKKYAKDKAKKEAELKKKGQLIKPAMVQALRKEPVEEEYKPKNIIQDEHGRIRDEHGNIINLKPTNTSSLKVNKNIEKKKGVDELLKPQRGFGNRNSKIFDPTVLSKSQTFRERRKNNAFQFVEKGSIIQKAEAIRGHSEPTLGLGDQPPGLVENDTLSKLQAIGSHAPASDIASGVRRVAVRVKRHDPIPDVEWWDAPLLLPGRRSYLPEENLAQEKEGIQKENYESGKGKKTEENNGNQEMDEEGKENGVNKEGLVATLKKNLEIVQSPEFSGEIFNKERINKVIEHPASFKTDANQNTVIPTYLTQDERKKLRRKKRLEKEKDKQEKIRFGIIKAPPPKVKFSNFMNIMKDEAVADPTKVEMEVRRQIQERLQNHLDRNAKKKLTKEQKAEKYMRKLRRDSAAECRVAVFRVEDLSHGAHKFKVNMNAQQLALNGVCIIADKKLGLGLPNVVVVEGGPKAIKFYKKLMLRRVRWNLRSQKEVVIPQVEGEPERTPKPQIDNKCILVWEGVLKDHNFNKWKVAEVKSELEGRRILADRGVEFYWDRALTSAEVADEDA